MSEDIRAAMERIGHAQEVLGEREWKALHVAAAAQRHDENPSCEGLLDAFGYEGETRVFAQQVFDAAVARMAAMPAGQEIMIPND